MKKRIWSRRLFAAVTLLLGIMLAVSAVSINRSGNIPPYSREAAAEKLCALRPLFALWLASLAAALVWGRPVLRRERLSAAEAGKLSGMKAFAGKADCRAGNESSSGCLVRATEKNLQKSRLRLFLLAAALVLIAYGAWNGGLRDVLIKAINICTECIGLG